MNVHSDRYVIKHSYVSSSRKCEDSDGGSAVIGVGGCACVTDSDKSRGRVAVINGGQCLWFCWLFLKIGGGVCYSTCIGNVVGSRGDGTVRYFIGSGFVIGCIKVIVGAWNVILLIVRW